MSSLKDRTECAQDQNQRRHFDPGNPVPARIAELERAVLAGKIAAEHAVIARVILCLLLPDRDRNWRTIKPVTYTRIAELHGCKERTVRTACARLRQRFQWFNWRKVEGGIVFKMGQDGCLIGRSSGKVVAHSDSRASNPKESPRTQSISKERTNTVSSGRRKERQVPVSSRVAGPTVDTPSVAARLSRWLAALPATVVAFGVELGLTRREVLATAERFVKWYTANPDRASADFTAAFCGYKWLPRDAARKAEAAAKRRRTSGAVVAGDDGVLRLLDDAPSDDQRDFHDIDDDDDDAWWSDHARDDAYADVPF
jgi:hypothetical protein